MSDRLALANAIEDAGIERSKAERVASVIIDAIHDNVATKADVQALHPEITAVRADLRAEIASVRADLRQTETRLAAEIASVRGDMGRMQDRIVIRLSGVMVVLLGILFAALKWHP
jgi:uncharacterized membrane protein